MFISKSHALKLIRQGKAECVSTTTEQVGCTHQMSWVINRFDMQRTDHVKLVTLGVYHLPLLGSK
jgi:hypothetical protein